MKHVLVVDDSPDTRELIQMIFTGAENIKIDFAGNSNDAIDLFNSNSYSACVLDVSLPDITGYYLGELIRKVCEHMPIAFLTNYEGSYTKENAEIIKAEFWAKADVFNNPMQLRDLIGDLAEEGNCEATEKIEKPELLKQLN